MQDWDAPTLSICYYTGCRIREARQLQAADWVGNRLVFRRATTKIKRIRALPIHPKLRTVLEETPLPTRGDLFPGQDGLKPITRQACDLALRKACNRLELRAIAPTATAAPWPLGWIGQGYACERFKT